MQNQNLLGKDIDSKLYEHYNPNLLFAIPRNIKRQELNMPENIFFGADIWNAYEVSWLNAKGKPIIAIANFVIDAASENIIESKSFKLYLNSFNQTKFNSVEQVQKLMQQDLSSRIKGRVGIKLILAHEFDIYFANINQNNQLKNPQGICLDRLDIEVNEYNLNVNFLKLNNENNDECIVDEILYSNLLKTNCLITSQPDWATIQIGYTGKKISQEGLIKYLISFRNHQEFHEQCVERIFFDILTYCRPIKLWVYANYTRRGGLDINPFRTNINISLPNFVRLARQ